jgi:hypothetical protein
MLRIANAQGFWGDDAEAAARTVSQAQVDVLTLDYCAEVSMSILARQKQKDPKLGYARDFLDTLKTLVPYIKRGGKIVTNAGGLNPRSCCDAATKLLVESGASGTLIGIVEGDDVLPAVRGGSERFEHLENKRPISDVLEKVITANAYIGADPVAQALAKGSKLIIAGRLADPSLTVAPAMAHFGWKTDDWDRLAGAAVAGHLIECGAQATGGIATHWLDVAGNGDIGFPIVDIEEDGSCVLTKPQNTGGEVSIRTATEQLLYEMGDPGNFLTPDVAVSILNVKLEQLGKDRVRISGAKGRPPTPSYKVSATYKAGFRSTCMLTIVGRDAVKKARRAGEIVHEKMKKRGFEPQRFNAELLGTGDAAGGLLGRREDLTEVVLRITCADERRETVEFFSRQLVPLVTAGPQGTTGYFDAKGEVREYYAYWPTLIDRNRLTLGHEVIEAK